MALQHLLLVFMVICNFWSVREGTSHWIVTEEGRIEMQVDSMLNMRRPYDLISLLQQEMRVEKIEEIRIDLIARKQKIDDTEEKSSKDKSMEQTFYRTDPDCVIAGKKLSEFDLYTTTVHPLENKGIKPEDYVNFEMEISQNKAPFCDQLPLDFSPYAFEHFYSLKVRRNLTGNPEKGLKNALEYLVDVDRYGTIVHYALQKNLTSWVLYNMAAFYWRVQGLAYEATECLRRALHLSPRAYKDIALVSLANVIHRSHYSKEAALIAHASLDISPDLIVHHFTLGNIYAILGEYSLSMAFYESTLQIQADMQEALKRKYAVLCHIKIEKVLEKEHRSLQHTLDNLRNYHIQHDAFTKLEKGIHKEKSSKMSRDITGLMYDITRLRDRAHRGVEHCEMKEVHGVIKLLCGQEEPNSGSDRHFNHVASMYNERSNRLPVRTNTLLPKELGLRYKPSLPPRYPLRNVKVKTTFYLKESWPSPDDCKTEQSWKNTGPAKYQTVYISANSKGFNLTTYLTDLLSLGPGAEHPLPWYPPICSNLAQLDDNERYELLLDCDGYY